MFYTINSSRLLITMFNFRLMYILSNYQRCPVPLMIWQVVYVCYLKHIIILTLWNRTFQISHYTCKINPIWMVWRTSCRFHTELGLVLSRATLPNLGLILKAVDTIGNYSKYVIIIIKPFLITSNGERLVV